MTHSSLACRQLRGLFNMTWALDTSVPQLQLADGFAFRGDVRFTVGAEITSLCHLSNGRLSLAARLDGCEHVWGTGKKIYWILYHYTAIKTLILQRFGGPGA